MQSRIDARGVSVARTGEQPVGAGVSARLACEFQYRRQCMRGGGRERRRVWEKGRWISFANLASARPHLDFQRYTETWFTHLQGPEHAGAAEMSRVLWRW